MIRRVVYIIIMLTILGIMYFPMRVKLVRWRTVQPQVILVLGGDPERILFAAQLSRRHPGMKILFSGACSSIDYNAFIKAGGHKEDFYIYERAIDTVTNFTTLVDEMSRRRISYVYLVTSDYHMRRACMIATVILGSHGIAFKPMRVPSGGKKKESLIHALRDYIRSLFWLVTGHTGATFKR